MTDTQPFSQNDDVSPWEPSNSPPLHTQDLQYDLPCEYCGSSIPASALVEHQASCEENPLVKYERRRHGKQGARNSGEDRRRTGGSFMRAKSGIWEVVGQSTGVRGNGCIDELIWWRCCE